MRRRYWGGCAPYYNGQARHQGAGPRDDCRKRDHGLEDLPNLTVNEDRKGSLYTMTSRVTLSDGLNTLFDRHGSTFIVHGLEDQYLPDPPTKDGPGGARIACGVIA
ncbi:MAG: superoxide dismutase family protein [Nitrospira sp.]|nr:superoxide dismutase family protein [Nitrospira sp.]